MFKRKEIDDQTLPKNKQKERFMKINIPVIHVLLEPFIALFLQIFCYCKCCNRFRIKQNQHVLETGVSRIMEKLDLVSNLQNDGDHNSWFVINPLRLPIPYD